MRTSYKAEFGSSIFPIGILVISKAEIIEPIYSIFGIKNSV